MRNEPFKFGYKYLVAATPLEYGIQFYPYMGKDENYDAAVGLGGSTFRKLIKMVRIKMVRTITFCGQLFQ